MDCHSCGSMALEAYWTDGEEVAVKRGDSLGLPVDSCTVVALGDKIEWVTFVGSSAPNEALLST